ncbi:hypothetical protein D0Z07_2428 [Hyphodiscus hymeniophilus]|uniref:Uncharacterized protein n=1 Tax=Hyphodiscus hymeniophilus TaxID=353542 RepID=A0A9P6VMM0_9HELO|nr:hypothetical protein D0Z07_2428 [Hyphodiscus hymeniophilus]
MRLRPHACSKAVPLQLSVACDSIWVSDEILSNAYQRFCSIPPTSRRHGSFVPGPMEARRRLGNRRMTQVSGAATSAPHGVEPIWGFFMEPDRTKWQWQAPKNRPPTQHESVSALPAWLLEWDTTPQAPLGGSVVSGIVDEGRFEMPFRVEDDIRQFRETIKRTSGRNNIKRVSAEFALQFKKNISLGLVSQDTLDNALDYVTEDLRTVYPNEKTTTYMQLAFYTHVWDGIVESQVLEPAEIDPKVMNKLFSLVVSLPLNPRVTGLAKMILDSATDSQLCVMEQSLTSLVKRWTGSWLKRQELKLPTEEFQCAELLVEEAGADVTNARRVIKAMEEDMNDEVALTMAQEVVAKAHAAIRTAMDAVANLQDASSPLQASAKCLARTLERLPAVERMSNDADMVRRAMNMWLLPPHKMKLGYALRAELVPKFIINLINSRHIHTKEIWKLLNIPFYEDLISVKYQPHQSKALPREMIDLMHKMAMAFAHTDARPPRVAQCTGITGTVKGD